MTTKCGSCAKFVGTVHVPCVGECGRVFHRACVVRILNLRPSEMHDDYVYRCITCTASTSEQSANTSSHRSPTRSPPSSPYRSPMRSDVPGTSGNITLEDIMAQLKVQQESLDNKLSAIFTSISGIRSEMSEIRSEVNSLSAAKIQAIGRLDNLESHAVSTLEELKNLKKSDSKTKADLVAIANVQRVHEARERANELCISGIPFNDAENPITLSLRAFSVIGVVIKEHNILDAFRLGKPNASSPPKLLVRLSSPRLCDLIFNTLRIKKLSLTASDIDSSYSKTRIYINPNVPRELYRLHKESKLWALKKGGFESVRIRDGAVHIHAKDGTHHTIHSHADFVNLTRAHHDQTPTL